MQITFTLAGAAHRLLLHNATPRHDVTVALVAAVRAKQGRGYCATVCCSRTTADEMAAHYASIAGVVGDMRGAEREGGNEGGVAARAAATIEAALRG